MNQGRSDNIENADENSGIKICNNMGNQPADAAPWNTATTTLPNIDLTTLA